MVTKCVTACLALLVVASCSTAPVQPGGYRSPSTGQASKSTPLHSYTKPAKREICGSFDEVSFGADGEVTVNSSGRARVCRGTDGKLHESAYPAATAIKITA